MLIKIAFVTSILLVVTANEFNESDDQYSSNIEDHHNNEDKNQYEAKNEYHPKGGYKPKKVFCLGKTVF